MAKVQKEVDVIYNQKSTGKGTQQIVDGLKAVENQANKTREKMEKLAQVGTKLALAGGAILAPLALAMKKYVDTTKGTERTSARILALNQKWEASQVRLGRIVATEVLPLLEQGAEILGKVIDFAEKNPGVVKAALTIGSTLVILGGILATTAQLVSTVATIQGLAASAGLLSVGGGAAGGAAAGGGIAAGITAGLAAFFTNVGIPLLALVVGGELGRLLGNWLSGTNQTWADIGNTVMGILKLNGIFFTKMLPGYIAQLGAAIGNGLKNLWGAIVSLFQGGKAGGGYVGAGLYAVGEQGREFVLNNQTTRSAERAIGGRLTQGSAMAAVTNNLQIGNGMTISQTRKLIRANEAAIMGSLAGAFS